MEAAEEIIICIDNSSWVTRELMEVQCQAIEFYCKKKYEANSETIVGLYTMGNCWHLFYPSRRSLEDIAERCSWLSPGFGLKNLDTALTYGLFPFLDQSKQKQEDRTKNLRMLIFLGSPIKLDHQNAVLYGEKLKKMGIAVDVVNFYLEEIFDGGASSYQYGKNELNMFVAACNNNNNSHIAHVDPINSEITVTLSEYILKNLTGKDNVNVNGEMEMSKNEAAADEEARGSEYGKHASLSDGELKVKNRAAADGNALGYEDYNVTLSKKKNNDAAADEEAHGYEDDNVTLCIASR